MYWFLNKQLLGEENDKKTRQGQKNIEGKQQKISKAKANSVPCQNL
jgi:hypothetical protein